MNEFAYKRVRVCLAELQDGRKIIPPCFGYWKIDEFKTGGDCFAIFLRSSENFAFYSGRTGVSGLTRMWLQLGRQSIYDSR